MRDPHPNRAGERPLLSLSTILILSGYLICAAMVLHNVDQPLQPFILACGLAGFLAFIAFDVAFLRRRRRQARHEQAWMQRRLEKHLTPMARLKQSPPHANSHSLPNP